MVTALGFEQKRAIQDNEDNDRMLHSLESMDFLKVDPENYILFECADEEKVISVEQEFHKGITEENKKNEEDDSATETKYDNIYSIKIYSITLRELLLF